MVHRRGPILGPHRSTRRGPREGATYGRARPPSVSSPSCGLPVFPSEPRSCSSSPAFVDDALAERLEGAHSREVKVLALDIPERETIIRAQRATKLSEFGRTDAS